MVSDKRRPGPAGPQQQQPTARAVPVGRQVVQATLPRSAIQHQQQQQQPMQRILPINNAVTRTPVRGLATNVARPGQQPQARPAAAPRPAQAVAAVHRVAVPAAAQPAPKPTSDPNKVIDLVDLSDDETSGPATPKPQTAANGGGLRMVPMGKLQNPVRPAAQNGGNSAVMAPGGGRVLVQPGAGPNGQPKTIIVPPGATLVPVSRAQALLPGQRGLSQVQQNKPRSHPAPLPGIPIQNSNPEWKAPPPKPTLKISKLKSGELCSPFSRPGPLFEFCFLSLGFRGNEG